MKHVEGNIMRIPVMYWQVALFKKWSKYMLQEINDIKTKRGKQNFMGITCFIDKFWDLQIYKNRWTKIIRFSWPVTALPTLQYITRIRLCKKIYAKKKTRTHIHTNSVKTLSPNHRPIWTVTNTHTKRNVKKEAILN